MNKKNFFKLTKRKIIIVITLLLAAAMVVVGWLVFNKNNSSDEPIPYRGIKLEITSIDASNSSKIKVYVKATNVLSSPVSVEFSSTNTSPSISVNGESALRSMRGGYSAGTAMTTVTLPPGGSREYMEEITSHSYEEEHYDRSKHTVSSHFKEGENEITATWHKGIRSKPFILIKSDLGFTVK